MAELLAEVLVLAALAVLTMVSARHLLRLERRMDLAKSTLQALVEVLAAELGRRDEEPRT